MNLSNRFVQACSDNGVPEIVTNNLRYSMDDPQNEWTMNAIYAAENSNPEFWQKATKASQPKYHRMIGLFWILITSGRSREHKTRTQNVQQTDREKIIKKIDELLVLLSKEKVTETLVLRNILHAMENTSLDQQAKSMIDRCEFMPIMFQFPKLTDYLKGVKSGFQNGFDRDPEPLKKPTEKTISREARFLTDICAWFQQQYSKTPEVSVDVVRDILTREGIHFDSSKDAVDLKTAAVRRARAENKQAFEASLSRH